jgi:hypothetical protein
MNNQLQDYTKEPHKEIRPEVHLRLSIGNHQKFANFVVELNWLRSVIPDEKYLSPYIQYLVAENKTHLNQDGLGPGR